MKIRAVTLAVGLVITASACAQGILPANSGTLNLGQTLAGVPVVAWYKVQQPLASLTATTDGAVFGVALVADTGSGHGTLPAAGFAQSVTANCNNCWLGVQFYSQVVGAASASLVLTASGGAGTETVGVQGVAVPGTGLVMSPLAQDFGTVAVHSSSAPVTFVMANLLPSLAAVTVESVSVSGDFELVSNGSGGAGCAGTVVAMGSCFVAVSFAPTAIGERDGVLTVVTSGGTATVTLTGIGLVDPGVALNPVALNFWSVPGVPAAQTVVVTNTGATTETVGSVSASDSSFSVSSGCGVLQGGASCSVTVGFTPQSATVSGTLTIPVRSGATLTNYSVALDGAYTAEDAGLEVVAGDVEFGATATDRLEASRLFTVNNLTAKEMSVTFSTPREFPLTPGAAVCTTLAANGSCSFSASFLPVTGGPLSGTVVARGTPTDGSAEVQGLAYLQGYGTPTGSLAITGYAIPNTPLGFGEVTSGGSVSEILTLTNSGLGTVTVRRITSEPPFLSTSNCGAALVAGASCSVTVTYAPVYMEATGVSSAPRSDRGSMTIESDAVSSPDEVAMTGTAVAVAGSSSIAAVVSEFGLSQGSVTFGNTQVGDISAAQTVTLTNTGTTAVHVLSTAVSTDFGVSSTCGTVAAGASCTFSVTFAPTTSAAVRSGTLEILSDAGTSLEFVSLVGVSTPAALMLSPAALDFGTVNVGVKEALSVSVSNVGSVGVTFLGLAVSGDYTVDRGTCPAVGSMLGVGEACVLTVTFQPIAVGTRSGTLSLANDASQVPLTVSLSGVGVEGTLTVTPGALAFGRVDVGFSEGLTLTLLNTGSAAVTGISGAIGGTNADDFTVTVPCPVTTLARNQGCSETVTFTPSAVGARAATLTVASSDPHGPATVALSGMGLAGGSFVLTVDGGSAATETVASGSPGSYGLLVTPSNGFSGNVALTCAPVTAGAYMSCSVLASTLTVGGTAAVSSTATISTISSADGTAVAVLAGLLVVPFGWLRRRRGVVVGPVLALGCGWLMGCGGGGAMVKSNVRTTPAGTYQYKVTASSTGGAVVSSSVTLTLVVR